MILTQRKFYAELLIMKNLKIVDKYITKQLVETFLVGIVIFTSIMFASQTFITLVKQIAMYGIPFNVAILIVILQLPTMLIYTIPMGVLLSTVMTINKMSIDSEITVMRSCGIGLTRIAKPVMIFGLAAAVSSFFINEMIVPSANSQAKILTLWALSQKNIPDGKKNYSFKEMNGPNLKRLFYVASVDNKKLNGVTVLDLSKKDSIQVIQSKYGKTTPEYWIFNKGAIYTMSTTGKILNTTVFNSLNLNNSVNFMEKVNRHKEKELNFFDLTKYISRLKNEQKQGSFNETTAKSMQKNIVDLTISLNEKFALPATAFILTIIGIPLAVTPPRVRFNRGLLFSILIIFCYYLIRAFSISLGASEVLSPIFSAWLPNIILGIVGLFMFYRKAYKI
jgi:lipopolysaccharide export system permease protein